MSTASAEESIARLVTPRNAESHRARERAAKLVADFGGLAALARADAADVEERLDRLGVGNSAEATRTLIAAFALVKEVAIAQAKTVERIESPDDVAAWAMPRIGDLMHEELWALFVDGRGHLRSSSCIAKGGLHGAAIRAADPLRQALRTGASAFVLVHNHPSGDETPSRQDVEFTQQVLAAGAIVGVPLLDHVVVTRHRFAVVSPDGGSA